MPLYDTLLSSGDKNPVLLEFGARFIKCGFVKDQEPRGIVKQPLDQTPLVQWNNAEFLYHRLQYELENLYRKPLAVNSRDRKVVVVKSVFCPTLFCETLVRVLLQHFNVPGIVMLPAHLMAMYTLAPARTALVVDVGYTECTVIPVCEGVTLMDGVRFGDLGAKALHQRFRQEFRPHALVSVKGEPPQKNDYYVRTIPNYVIENIVTKCCYVAEYERGQLLAQLKDELTEPLKKESELFKHVWGSGPFPFECEIEGGVGKIVIPGFIRDSVSQVFFEFSGHESNITTMILDAITAAPVDCRRALASNIILIGGTTMMLGFGPRLCDELKHVVEQSPAYRDKIWLKEFKFHKLPCKPNIVSWLGASIYASTDAGLSRTITLKDYEQRGRAVLQDWNDWQPFRADVPRRAQS